MKHFRSASHPKTVILRTFFLRFKFTIDGGIEVLDRINVELGPYDELDRNPGTRDIILKAM